MRSLSDQEKKLFSRIGIALAAIVFLGALYIWTITLVSRWDAKYLQREKGLIEHYNNKIDSIKDVNKILDYQVYILEKNVDSLKSLDHEIYVEYEKKINVISDASASNHAEWMDSTLTKLEHKGKR